MKAINLTLTVLAMILVLSGTSHSSARTADINPNTINAIDTVDSMPEMNTVEMVDKVIPTVVYIFMERILDSGSEEFGGLMPSLPRPSNGVGTGFFINDQGYILTNAHVVKNTQKLVIYYWDSPLEYDEAQIVGMDEVADIAVIKITPEGPTEHVTWGNSEYVRLGEDVVAIGHGLSMPFAVTKGIISMTHRQPDMSKPMILYNQSDTVINQGNSGGPLFNMRGEVVGVNTLLFSRTGSFAGVGFSIPSNLAQRSVRQIMETAEFDEQGNVVKQGVVTYPAIGIRFSPIETIEERNKLKDIGIVSLVKVQETPEDGAAYEAGMMPGDVIVQVGGIEIYNSIDLIRQLWYNDIGDILKIKVYRNNEYVDIDVKLKEFKFMNTKGK
tara:strand:+ start:231 stop:1382 length:1152 start_codon:yes stop_codon:yes gene_type:complete